MVCADIFLKLFRAAPHSYVDLVIFKIAVQSVGTYEIQTVFDLADWNPEIADCDQVGNSLI